MRIKSYKANCERRRARHHVATTERTALSVQANWSTPPQPSDFVQVTTEGQDGRVYVLDLDREDLARIVAHACDAWAQHPTELAHGHVPREREVITCTITSELISPGRAIEPVYRVSIGDSLDDVGEDEASEEWE